MRGHLSSSRYVGDSRREWDKLAGGIKLPPPPVRYMTKDDWITQVSSHLSLLELTRGKISKLCTSQFH